MKIFKLINKEFFKFLRKYLAARGEFELMIISCEFKG